MGDEDQDFLNEAVEDSTDIDGGAKTGFLPGVLIRVLRWVAIAVGIIIVSGTTAFFVVRVASRGSLTDDLSVISPEYQAKRAPLENFDNIDAIRGVTSDQEPAIFTVQVSLLYEFGNTAVNTELTQRRREIQNLIFLHVSQKSVSELRPENYATLQEELKQQVNRIMSQGRIDQVVFREFVVAR